MKYFILAFLIGMLSFKPAFAQQDQKQILLEELIKQSENRKKTGLTMMAIGGGAVGLGLVLAASSSDWSDGSFAGGIILAGAGSLAVLAGIPILAGSASKARQAAQLSLTTVRALPPSQTLRGPTTIPSLTFSISLSSSKR
ncbi:MAG: hypothetical protein B7Z16_04030 [Algoriphagus sp. 32-45-6]|nr:MAG: hypothetical protein B7Z16_04030 [Algoriphagus sp. 32-45-6]